MGELVIIMVLNIWDVYLDTAFWLLLGLIAAGLIKVYMPEDMMKKWMGGRGFLAVGRAALFGAPLPLCSCGVLPAAIGLRRAGASREATVSFLISTPETSVDSVAVTYALMGPVMAVYRPISALVSAIVTGMLVSLLNDEKAPLPLTTPETKATTGCCSVNDDGDACCATETLKPSGHKLRQALVYAGSELLDDISKWMALGIVFAGIMMAVIPPGWLAQWGEGIGAMLVMLLVGIPMYICAVASTPVAVGLLVAGISPGAVLVFLLVGPATNIAGLMLIKQELGSRLTLIYLLGLSVMSLVMGGLLEFLLHWGIAGYSLQVDPMAQQQAGFIPNELSLLSGILLLVLAIPAIRNRLMPFFLTRTGY
jgi:uncharacterized protein